MKRDLKQTVYVVNQYAEPLYQVKTTTYEELLASYNDSGNKERKFFVDDYCDYTDESSDEFALYEKMAGKPHLVETFKNYDEAINALYAAIENAFLNDDESVHVFDTLAEAEDFAKMLRDRDSE
jgi:hypothetical protein